MRFSNNERTWAYVTCEKIASDTVIRKIVYSINERDIQVWVSHPISISARI